MDHTTVTLAHAVAIDPAALYIACRARLAIQPILDFFSLLLLRRRLGTLSFSTLFPANISTLPLELLAMIQVKALLSANMLVMETLAEEVGPCPCGGRSVEQVCRVHRPFDSCLTNRCSEDGCPDGCCYGSSEEAARALLKEFRPVTFNDPVPAVLRMYQLKLVNAPNLVGSFYALRITPTLIGLPFQPLRPATATPSCSISSHFIPKLDPTLSRLECDEEEQDQTRIFALGSASLTLSAGQKGRFKAFLLDLGLRQDATARAVDSVSMSAPSVEKRKDEDEERCEPKLMLVHSAAFRAY